MTFLRQHPMSVPLAVGSSLLTLWLAGGLATALLGAALADLGLSIVERRRTRRTSAHVPHRQG